MKRFLILSDIHACDVDPSSSAAPSYVSSFASISEKSDPITALENLVAQENLSPDYILCAGDITNRSNPNSFSYAWRRLNQLASSTGARLVATVGNHDLDSRYMSNNYNSREYAMSLTPTIPFPERARALEYWAEHFTLITFDDCNILVLNTAAHHGGGKDAGAEIEHGRISESTLKGIEASLEGAPARSINVLLCHHHPIKVEASDHELTGMMRGGDKLVQTLDRANSSWVVVHGHKHTPDLFYGHGGANAPVILGCASFSAQVNIDAQNKNPNQVHLLVCDPDAANDSALSSAGRVLSWTWQPGVGWRKSHGPLGLPHTAGFGYRGSIKSLAGQIDVYLNQAGINQTSWDVAVGVVPDLARLIPQDFVALERELTSRGMAVLTDRDGRIAQVGRTS